MTPKEKAIQLRDKYIFTAFNVDEDYKDFMFKILIQAKHCALIAVNEILDLDLHDVGYYKNDQSSSDDFSTATWYINYWEEVKQEIEKL